MFKDNENYILQHEAPGGFRFYVPTNPAEGYHTSRWVEVLNQQIYASGGATKDVLGHTMREIVLLCNKREGLDTVKTDIAGLANSILYRLEYPVDELCGLRMGAVLTFMEYENGEGRTISEDPSRYDKFWVDRKLVIAKDDPDSYAFFLGLGLSNIPDYKERLLILNLTDYFQQREETISSLRPAKNLGQSQQG